MTIAFAPGRQRGVLRITHFGIRVALLGGISCASLLGNADAQTARHKHATTTHAKKTTAPSRKGTSTGTPAPGTVMAPTAPAPAATLTPVQSTNAVSSLPTPTSSNSEEIVVTGTRLSQTRLTNVMAGTTITAEQLHKRGYADLGLALLRENSAMGVGDNSPIGNQGSFGAGQSFSSLLNLGSQRTLTLVNGMRMVGGATASLYGAGSGSQVDVSTIPTSLIKSVDMKIGGAGAAYGSDAVAGVINYTLDDHFKGVDFTAQGGWTQQLDAPSEKIAFKAGTTFDHEKGGIVFDVEYRNNGGLVANDRRTIFGRDAWSYGTAALGTNSDYTYNLYRSRRFIQNSVTGMPLTAGAYGSLPAYAGSAGLPRAGMARYGIPGANGHALMFTPDGQSLVPMDTGILEQADTTHSIGGNGIALQDYNQLYAPTDKLNLTMLGHYDFTDHIHATWQGWYARGKAESDVAQGTWSTPQFDDALTLNSGGMNNSSYYTNDVVNGAFALSTNNPYLTPAERETIRAGLIARGQSPDTFYLSRLNQDLDAGLYRTMVQMYRFQGGLNGDFDAVGRKFNWSVRGEYSRYLNDTWQPSIVIPNLVNALNAVQDSSGNIVCAPGYQSAPIQTRSSVCAPLNPFGSNQMTPGARDYVISDAHSFNSNAQRDLQAEISSTVFRLPAGDIRWDLGYEHRREGYNFNPGAFFQGWPQGDGTYQQYGNSTVIYPVSGHYLTHEVFGELDVPLVSPDMHLPGAYHISATANGRFIHNSIAGNYWTYLFGGSWWPTQDIGLSGNYAQSVRNPSVTELFSPLGTDYESGIDPCSTQGITQGPNPGIRARNCGAAGITQPFVSTFNAQTIPGLAGGNSRLANEVSKSYTASLEFRPHFVRGLDITGSFVDVKIKNAITSLGAQDLMDACYDSPSYPSNQYCNSFTRDSSGQLDTFQAGYYNIATFHTQAMQAHFDYYMPLTRLGLSRGFGDIDISGNYTHYVKSTSSYLGTTYLNTGTTTAPNDLFTLNANYIRGPLTFQWQTIWYGPSRYAVQVPATSYEYNKRPSFAYFNMTVGYEITPNISANFLINNVTDALPNYAGTVSVTRYYETLIGRSFMLSLGAHF